MASEVCAIQRVEYTDRSPAATAIPFTVIAVAIV
jgi:hypothetical protein